MDLEDWNQAKTLFKKIRMCINSTGRFTFPLAGSKDPLSFRLPDLISIYKGAVLPIKNIVATHPGGWME